MAKPTSAPKKTESKTTSTLSWLPKKTFELTVTIPWELVTKTYQVVLNHAIEHVTVKGFRKGKAPKTMVEKQIGVSQLYEDVIRHIVPEAYAEAVRHHHLHPIMNPDIQPVSMQEKQNWVVKATACEAPEIDLGKYKEEIKGVKAKDTIWTPDKAEKPSEENQDQQEAKQLEKVLDTLLATAKVEISDLMLDKETNRMLSKLLDQTNSLGMTIEQYLSTKGMSQTELRRQYHDAAERDLKLEFVLMKVAEDAKIEVPEAELKAFTSRVATDEKARQTLETPEQQAYLSHILRKQKTIDYLKSL